MNHALLVVLLCAVPVTLSGCDSEDSEGSGGGSSSSSGPSTKSKAKERLEELFELAKKDDFAGAAEYVVYRGDDREASWKRTCTLPDDQRRVEQVCAMIKDLLSAGDPEFEYFGRKEEREGQWLLWQVNLGERMMLFACLKIDGKIALGDIDMLRTPLREQLENSSKSGPGHYDGKSDSSNRYESSYPTKSRPIPRRKTE